MDRVYEELPCGCLVSNDGGGGLIYCNIGYAEYMGDLEQYKLKEIELHRECMRLYFEEGYTVQQVIDTIALRKQNKNK